ncbi:MAG: hypothetical protein QGD94_06410 [Planctomycetia bacterium]|nr:hypothetical protein [Planctomycetia bacterium]
MFKLVALAVGHRHANAWGDTYSVKHYSVWLDPEAGRLTLKMGNKVVRHFDGEDAHMQEVFWHLSPSSDPKPAFFTTPPPEWLGQSDFLDGWEMVNEDALIEEIERVYQCRWDGPIMPAGGRQAERRRFL